MDIPADIAMGAQTVSGEAVDPLPDPSRQADPLLTNEDEKIETLLASSFSQPSTFSSLASSPRPSPIGPMSLSSVTVTGGVDGLTALGSIDHFQTDINTGRKQTANVEEKSSGHSAPSPNAAPSATRPIVMSRTPSKVMKRATGGGGGELDTPNRQTPTSMRSSSATKLRTTPSSSSSATIGGAWNWEFPDGNDPTTNRLSTPKKGHGAGVFKQYFSPNQQNSQSSYIVSNTNTSSTPIVPSPMAEFHSTISSSQTPGRGDRVKQMERISKKSLETRRNSGSATTPIRIETPTSAARNRSIPRNLGHSASAITLPTTSISALGISHSSTAAAAAATTVSAGASAAGRDAADAYTRSTGESSFARRMIHAQSAAELYVPPPFEPMTNDPNASSLYFSTTPNSNVSGSVRHPTRVDEPTDDGDPHHADAADEDDTIHGLVVPYGGSSSANPYSPYSNRTATSTPNRRPHTAAVAGVSNSGVAWSEKLTATLTETTPSKKKKKPASSPSTTPLRPSTSSHRQSTLPPELTIGVDGMSPTMQREHAALAKMIRSLEPAGRASLVQGSIFTKLNNASRTQLFHKSSQHQEPSQTTRLPTSSEADEFLRKRSIQKQIENRAQLSSALGTTRGPSGLAGSNLSGGDVADAVARTNSDYGTITDERPRPTRPETAHPLVGIAIAASPVGTDVTDKILQRLSSPNKRPGTSGSNRPMTSAGHHRRSSSRSGGVGGSGDILLPGGTSTTPSSSSSSSTHLVGGGVLGFGGSIDRYSSMIEAHRHAHASTSSLGGRGMLSSKTVQTLLHANQPASITSTSGVETHSNGLAKRFNSLALEFEVSLSERLSRCAASSASTSTTSRQQRNDSSSSSSNPLTMTPSEALERLDVFRTTFDAIILHSPHFGSLLSKIKSEYEAFVRRGYGTSGSGGGGSGNVNSSPSTLSQRRPFSNSTTSSTQDSDSQSSLNQQQIEDTLILENHRLNTKLHGFQRAYTSLYAKYKTQLQTCKVQEGILSQNALVLKDLNEQLQQSILSSMSEEERIMSQMRRDGFKLSNEIGEDEVERQYQLEQGLVRASLPELDIDLSDEELDLGDATEESRKKIHERRVKKAAEAALKKKQREMDPLEHGRKLMREYKGPLGGKSMAETTMANLYTGEEDDDGEGESGILSPQKLVSWLDESSQDDVALRHHHADNDDDDDAGSSSPSDPSSKILSSYEDPLHYMKHHSHRDFQNLQLKIRQLEDERLVMQTQIDQARSKELAALMAMEEFSKQKYLIEKAARENQINMTTSSSAATATAAASSDRQMRAPSSSNVGSRRRTGDRPIASSPSASPTHVALPAHAMLDNIEPTHGRVHSIPSLPIDEVKHGYGENGYGDDADDEDPDSTLVDDSSTAASLAVTHTMRELQVQQQLTDLHLSVLQSSESDLHLTDAHRRAAADEADRVMQEEMMAQQARRGNMRT